MASSQGMLPGPSSILFVFLHLVKFECFRWWAPLHIVLCAIADLTRASLPSRRSSSKVSVSTPKRQSTTSYRGMGSSSW